MFNFPNQIQSVNYGTEENNSDDSNDLNSNNYINEPPLEDNIETILSIFPLKSELGKRKYNDVSFNEDDDEIKQCDESFVKSILFPTDDDLMGDVMNRVSINNSSFKKRRIEQQKKQTSILSKLNNRIEKLSKNENSSLFQKIKPPKIFKTKRTVKKHPPKFVKFPSIQLPKILLPKEKIKPPPKPRPKHYKTNVSTEELIQKFVQKYVPKIAKQYTFMPPNQFGIQLVSPYKMYIYQVKTIDWLIKIEDGIIVNKFYKGETRGGLLAMVMGLGKSLCSISLVARTLMQQRLEGSCSLYICPKNLLGTIRYEVEKFFGNSIKVLIYHKDFLRSAYDKFDASQIKNYDLIITNYATMVTRMNQCGHFDKDTTEKQNKDPAKFQTAHDFTNFNWFRVILDESHEIREKKTKRFKCATALKSLRKICLTGTPIHNKLDDLFAQLAFTGFSMPRGWKASKETFEKLELNNMVRFVELKDVKSVELPPKTVHKVYFDLNKKERYLHTYFKENAKKVFTQIDGFSGLGRSKKQLETFACITRVIQVCSAPYLITPASKQKCKSNEDMMDIDNENYVLPDQQLNEWVQNKDGEAGIQSSKMNKFCELLIDIMENKGGKTVVFANYTSTLMLAIAAMSNKYMDFENKHVFVHGGITSSSKRDTLYTSFRTDTKIEVLFMTLKVGSVGLNLSEACNVIFIEPWYSYASLSQGEGRVHRIGQVNPVNIFYLLAKSSVEERVYQTAQEKRKLAEDISTSSGKTIGYNEMKGILFDDDVEMT